MTASSCHLLGILEETEGNTIDIFISVSVLAHSLDSLVEGTYQLPIIKNTILLGLIVAMILQVFYNFILSRIESNVADMEDSSITMLDILMKYNVKK